jgi:hypothetical protein
LAAASYGARPALDDATMPTGFDANAVRLFESIIEAAFLVACADGVFDAEERVAFERIVTLACGGSVPQRQIEEPVTDLSAQLDREGIDTLEHEMERLRRQTKRITWLNPLLRYDGFEALAGGIKAMMPHVDEFRPVHSLDSLRDLATALAGAPGAEHDPRKWMKRGLH